MFNNESNNAILPAAMQNLVMAPPAELMAALAGNFADAYTDFGSQFRSISLKGFQFTLKESGSATVWPHPNMAVVILAMGPDNHCTWYENAYTGDDTIQPTAVWYQKQGAPASVPASVLVKDASGRNQYKISRRIVVALARVHPNTGEMYIDLDAPYVLDVGSMSIFGDDMPDQMAFSLAGLIRFCARHKILPLHFITQIVFDRTASVPSIRFIPSHSNGQVLYLPEDTLAKVYQSAISQEVAQMVKVTLTKDGPVAPPAPSQIPVTRPQTVQQPYQPPVQPVQQPVYQQPVQPVQQPQPVYQQPMQPQVQPQPQPVYQQPVQQPVYQQPVQPQVPPMPPVQQPVQQPVPPVPPMQPEALLDDGVTSDAVMQEAQQAASQAQDMIDNSDIPNALEQLLKDAGVYGDPHDNV